MTLAPGENVVIYETTLTSELEFDRPILWAEHATVGSPFLEPGVTVVDFPAGSRSKNHVPTTLKRDLYPSAFPPTSTSPGPTRAHRGTAKTVDLRAPRPSIPTPETHTASLIDPKRKLAFATAINPKRGLDCRLDFQAGGISLAAELGKLSADREAGPGHGVLHAALRPPAPRCD